MGTGTAGGARGKVSGFGAKQNAIMASIIGTNENISKNDLLNTFAIPGVFPKESLRITPTISEDGKRMFIDIKAMGSGVDYSRTLYFTKGKPGSADHDLFFLPKDVQGKGIAKELFKRSLALYDRMGIKKIDLSAVSVGGYAWAKYGFENTDYSKFTSRKAMSKEINELLGFKKFSKNNTMLEFSNIKISKKDIGKLNLDTIKIEKKIERLGKKINKIDSSRVWEIRKYQDEKIRLQNKAIERSRISKAVTEKDPFFFDKQGNFLLGKRYLIGKDWSGTIDISKGSEKRAYLDSILNSKERD